MLCPSCAVHKKEYTVQSKSTMVVLSDWKIHFYVRFFYQVNIFVWLIPWISFNIKDFVKDRLLIWDCASLILILCISFKIQISMTNYNTLYQWFISYYLILFHIISYYFILFHIISYYWFISNSLFFTRIGNFIVT